MFTDCTTVNDYIETIFRVGLQERDMMVIDGTEYHGYYLKVPYRKVDNNLTCWERLFVNLKSKSGKLYGNNDTENAFADCLLWTTEYLKDILEGNNENFSIEQGIETLLTTEGEKIVNYIQKHVDLQLKSFINTNKCPYHTTNKDQIEVSLLDNYDYLMEDTAESHNGEKLVKELLEGDVLTKKQKEYLRTITTAPNYNKDGAIYGEDNKRIYSKGRSSFYRKKLREATNKKGE